MKSHLELEFIGFLNDKGKTLSILEKYQNMYKNAPIEFNTSLFV